MNVTIAADGPKVSEVELPISGCTVVVTERGARQTLELLNPEGTLLGVVSDSLLDPSVIRAAFRGSKDGKPWALAAGRSLKTPVRATFSASRARRDGRRIEVDAIACGGFWVAEAAVGASRVSVTVDGEDAGSAGLQPIS
jgi:hypothetical protein